MPGLMELLQAFGVPPGALTPQQPGDIRGVPMAPGGALMPEWLTSLRARNAARPMGPGMQGYGPTPGGAMDQQEGAAFGFPLAVEAFTPDRIGNFAKGPPAVTSLDGGGPIPLPPSAREGSFSSRATAPDQPVAAPMSLAPPAPGPMAPPMAGPSPAMPPMGGMGGGRGSGALLAALAGGFAGAPSFGSGMRRAFSNAAPLMAANEQRAEALDLQKQSQTDVIKAMQAKGVPNTEIMAALRNPVFMKEITDKYFGKQPEVKPPTRETFNTEEGKLVKQWNPATGNWDTIPGQTPDPGDKRRSLSVADVKTLSKDARNVQAINRYATTFKDSYAGDISDTYGEVKNTVGAKMPGASKNLKERSDWWRDYQEDRNNVRHGLYGSALTAQETASFLAQDITPGMQPDRVKEVLRRQNEIVQTALKREGRALIAAGHRREAIAEAYGVSPSFFDEAAKAKPRGGGKTRGGMAWSVVTDGED
jgi:hypothetical protein